MTKLDLNNKDDIQERIEEIDFEIMILDIYRAYDRDLSFRIINKLMDEKNKLLKELQ